MPEIDCDLRFPKTREVSNFEVIERGLLRRKIRHHYAIYRICSCGFSVGAVANQVKPDNCFPLIFGGGSHNTQIVCSGCGKNTSKTSLYIARAVLTERRPFPFMKWQTVSASFDILREFNEAKEQER